MKLDDPVGLNEQACRGERAVVLHDTKVEPFPEARKPSWKVTADFGPLVGTLTTSAQITRYPENELVDRMIVGAINLGEKRIAGFKSQFLILGTLDPDGTVRLLQLEDGAEPGQTVA